MPEPPETPPVLPSTARLAAEFVALPAGTGPAGGLTGRIEATTGYALEGAVVELVGPRGERGSPATCPPGMLIESKPRGRSPIAP